MAQVKSVSELNKLKVRLFVEAVLNEGQLELIDDLVAVDYMGHISCTGTVLTGPQGVRQLVSSRRHAHPGLHFKIEDMFAEDDRVVTRWRATATGPGAHSVGAAARQVPCCAGISIIRLLAGKQVDACTQCTNLTSQPDGWKRAPARPGHPAR